MSFIKILLVLLILNKSQAKFSKDSNIGLADLTGLKTQYKRHIYNVISLKKEVVGDDNLNERCDIYFGCGKNGKCWAGCGKYKSGDSMYKSDWCYTSNENVCQTNSDCYTYRCKSCTTQCQPDN